MGFLLNAVEESSLSQRVNLESFSDSRILITGSTGMVGAMLTECIYYLLNSQGIRGWTITAVSNRGDFSNLTGISSDSRVKLVKVNKFDNLQFANQDIVFHLASLGSPTQFGTLAEMNQVNSGFIDLFFSGIVSPRKILFVSSSEVYGSNAPAGVREDFIGIIDHKLARSNYPISKKMAEVKLKEVSSTTEVNVSIARLFHTFGPGIRRNDGRSFGDFLENAVLGKAPILKSKGQNVRSILYSLDSAVALLAILSTRSNRHDFDENIFNVGSDSPITIREFAQAVSDVCGLSNPVFAESKLDGLVEHSPNSMLLPDVSKLRSIGWEPTFDVTHAIGRTLEWMRDSR